MNKKREKILLRIEILTTLPMLLCGNFLYAQTAMVNVQSCNLTSLNGDWQVVLDPTGIGDWNRFGKKKASEKDRLR